MNIANNKPRLTLYGDMLSQPVRSVYAFLKINNIPFKFELINLAKGEHMTEEYEKINPMKKVPSITFLKDDGELFKLSESCTILRFLADYYQVDEKWYPRKDAFRRAKIDEQLDWHHLNTRIALASMVFRTILLPKLKEMGIERDVPDTTKKMNSVLNHLNKHFKNSKYMVDDTISIADLITACEVSQLYLLNQDFSKLEYLNEYLNRINSMKEMQEANKILNKMRMASKF